MVSFIFRNINLIEFQKAENIKELALLTSEIWHEYWTCILSDEQINYMVEKFQSEDAIKNQIENEEYHYFYIMFDSIKVGYIGLSTSNKEYLFLSKLYIKKEYRYNGIGTQAFEFIKEFAEEYGYKKIHLTVNKYNENTIKAYDKWGFKTVDAVVTDIGQGFVMDDYIMEYKM